MIIVLRGRFSMAVDLLLERRQASRRATSTSLVVVLRFRRRLELLLQPILLAFERSCLRSSCAACAAAISGAAYASAIVSAAPCSGAGPRRRRRRTRPSSRSPCVVYGSNLWSWHWAQPIVAPSHTADSCARGRPRRSPGTPSAARPLRATFAAGGCSRVAIF